MMTRNTFVWGTQVGRSDGPIPFLQYSPRRRHVAELLFDLERWRDRTHLIQGGRRLTFGDLSLASDRVASQLAANGLEPGERLLEPPRGGARREVGQTLAGDRGPAATRALARRDQRPPGGRCGNAPSLD